MRPKYRLLAIFGALLLQLLIVVVAKSQSYTSIKKVLNGSAELVPNAEISVQDSVFFNATLTNKLESQYPLKNAITLKLNEYSSVYINSSFTVTANLQITYIGNDKVQRSMQKQLELRYDTGKAYTNRSSFLFSNAHQVTVKLLGITSTNNTALATVMLENEMMVKPSFKLDRTTDAVKNIKIDPVSADKDEAVVSWNYVLGADVYDVEWAYIDSSVIASGRYGSPINYETLFRNNTTRVTVESNKYNIPLLYDNGGFLYVRVRAVAVKPNNGRLETLWSNVANGGVASISYPGHQHNLNWQASVSYAEGGKRKAVVNYFDGNFMNRQTVTKDNTTNTTVVAETLYDKQGRPAIQVLPAPTLSNIIQYTARFNTGINGQEYDKGQYDTILSPRDIISGAAPEMGRNGGASQYYSPQNPKANEGANAFIPDAEGYPFTEIMYTPDNTGRISKQGGVGPTFRINGGHATRYYYGSPSQQELDRLFGTEAGDASHYFKNMVQDANGQMSVTYTDMHGRTVATALAGTDEGKQLNGLPTNIPKQLIDTLSGPSNTQVKDFMLTTRKSLLVESDGVYFFKYDLVPPVLKLQDCNKNDVSYTGKYDLEIKITDDVQNLLLENERPFIKTKTISGPYSDTFTIFLRKGNYEITKSLTINEAEMNRYRDEVFLPGSVCISKEVITQEQRTLLNNKGCAPTCISCLAELGPLATFSTVYMQRAGLNVADSASYRAEIAAAYAQQQDYCKILCNTANETDRIKTAMLQDLIPPGGQYANPGDVTDKYSIFFSSDDKRIPPYKNPSIVYLDADGKCAVVFDEMTQKDVIPQLLSPEQFTAKFKASWAEQLLPYHPEYSKYKEYSSYDPSKQWSDQVRKVDTYQEALAKGYLNPTNNSSRLAYGSPTPTNMDPFVTMSNKNLSDVEAFMTAYNYAGDSKKYNIYSVSAAAIACQDGSCIDTYQGYSDVFSAKNTCVGDQNMIWRSFREMYIARRDELISKAIDNLNGSITANELTQAGKVTHFGNAADQLKKNGYGALLPGVSQATVQHFSDSANAASKDSICNMYIATWMKQLQPCKYTENDLIEIKSRLLAVCKASIDVDHPYGASSVPRGNGMRDTSFEFVLTDFNSNHPNPQRPQGCPSMITMPAPYYAQNIAITKTTYSRPADCECTKITAAKNEYNVAHISGESFAQYLLRTQKIQLTQTQLDDLLNACIGMGSCVYNDRPLVIPAAFQCYNPPPCTNCIVVNNYYNSFLQTYPGIKPDSTGIDSLHQMYNQVFANYMNSRLGFNYQAGEYLAFIDSCKHSYYVDSIISTPNFVTSAITLPRNVTLRDGRPTPDGGFVFVGSIPIASDMPFILKVDSKGNPLWQKYINSISTSNSFFYRVMVTKDGSILACGAADGSVTINTDDILTRSAPTTVNGAGIIVKFNSAGTILWNKGINGGQPEMVREMIELKNGDYAFTGDYNYRGVQQWMAGVISSSGNLLWRKQLAVRTNSLAQRIIEDNDTLVVAGLSTVSNALFQPYILRWNKNTGVFIKSYSLESAKKSDISSFTLMPNGAYRLGMVQSGSNAATNGPGVFVDVTPAGVITRQRQVATVEGGTFSWLMTSLQPDGSMLWAPDINNSGYPAYLLSISSAGTVNWAKKLTYANGNMKWTGMVGNRVISLGNNSGKPTIYNFKPSAASDCESAVAAVADTLANSYTISQYSTTESTLPNTVFGTISQQEAPLTATASILPCGTGGTSEDYHVYYGPTLCGQSRATFELPAMDTINSCSDSTFFINNTVTEIYNAKIDSVKTDFAARYLSNCLKASENEQFTVSHSQSEYHYTLYYYDQAGNLTMTVPPAGVSLDTTTSWLNRVSLARKAGMSLVPNHQLTTRYRYNSLNQVTDQLSPDGGQSHFWYDRLGRLAVSQNSRQLDNNAYSYTLYDYLGRITEVGEITSALAMTDAISKNQNSLASWINNAGGTRTQIVQTTYDLPYNQLVGSTELITQKNLRNRVSWVAYLNNVADMSVFNHGTFYSYDIHGNVDTLLQDFRGSVMDNKMNRFKAIAYDYDLVSGKVNKVSYQPGKIDGFYHRYSYDAENRITDVETSTDDFHWEKDAYYSYYKHGPLARAVIGQQQVQGIDYAYTLQGWLKGVNGGVIGANGDMGGDGGTNTIIPKDAFSFSLNYYGDNDYKAIGLSDKIAKGAGSNTALFRPLYNGNIAAMGVNIPSLGDPLLYTYKYDVLNRISSMTAAKGLNTSNNIWLPAAIPDFKEEVTYDANGNIQTYNRNGNTMVPGNQLAMDRLTYFYNPNNNQLNYVDDTVDSANYTNDIDKQLPGNYKYDKIGNLVRDAGGGIDSIYWTVYGKISRIKKFDNTVISYSYDAAGNRISKQVNGIGTYYVRDASGNVMSIYSNGNAGINGGQLSLIETDIYGSSRLGVINQAINVENRTYPDTTYIEGAGNGINNIFTRGNKVFELTNHLGNVLETVSDRKRAISTDGTTIDHYEPVLLSAHDYYPFGMLMPGRGGSLDTSGNWTISRGGTIPVDLTVNSRSGNQPSEYLASNSIIFEDGFETGVSDELEARIVAVDTGSGGSNGSGGSATTGGYRYGFNGKENDNEVKGEGDQQDYGMRIYDPRIGKFLSVDPLTRQYPHYTPYSFAGNKPIAFIDANGAGEEPSLFKQFVQMFVQIGSRHSNDVEVESERQASAASGKDAFSSMSEKSEKVLDFQKGIYSWLPGGNTLFTLLDPRRTSRKEVLEAGLTEATFIFVAGKVGGSLQEKFIQNFNRSAKRFGTKWVDFASSWEIHHIVPRGLAEHPLIKKLTKAKLFDIEGLENGTILPKYSTTRGLADGMHSKHPEYNTYVQKVLDRIDEAVRNSKLSLPEAEVEIRKMNQKINNVFEELLKDTKKVDKRINEYFRELNSSGKQL
ncbi:MAG: AHH domain-containing protein [Chitinophaga sp.]|uniref:RHS repeat-associated core domain-containing protein n=1 Tax=Chitinophaga sp. TaxID=1869181 RepID=UPI0025BA01CA|nr:RHS repeat-associated core domain-containing protein [Chitinophaga sp.]MBV8255407.1 AHH domain-containing protein [Chitinophaga sp.]